MYTQAIIILMKKQHMTRLIWSLSATLLILTLFSQSQSTPLDDYVNAPDDHYIYQEIASFRGPDYTMYTYNMTSQKWKDERFVDRPIWWHYLTVTIPDKMVFDSAYLLIDGGSNSDSLPSVTDPFVALTTLFAASTGAISADLKMVPNQPIVFNADPEKKKRGEDAIIAWTWKTFVMTNSSDPEILLRMPMTKAAVRALDTITSIAASKVGRTVDKFFVSGASKRGWTTWTTGAVDKRVVAIAPIVMDLLNMVKNLHHHYQSLGGWTFALSDYYDVNFTSDLDNPNTQKMANIIDPISYNDRFINKPKYIITTGGDEFFIPDNSDYYFDQLKGPKYLRKLPNADHSCVGHVIDLMFSLRAFFLSVMLNEPLPKMEWIKVTTSNGGKILLTLDRQPLTIHAFYAQTLDGKRRDFRLLRGTPGNPRKPQIHPVIWLTRDVTALGNGTFQVEFENPKEGWLAFFIQVAFPGLMDSVLEFTTQAMIIPNTFPFEDCHGEKCLGELV
ncbi:hypothetical protein CHS0354_033324 [Potamilus streckersoni]|uniref:Autocrine proliferation repressor A-like n=1 Tax=Potamilus streckersoni TaxID=2493646 RepID=A0AAE0RTA6_9BIVA|nr:hypothetical protein CHS0354_033324 [Potamilus streckersoni]